MRFSAAILLGAAGLAAAQSSTAAAPAAPSTSGTPSGCGSATDLIIQSCLGTTTPLVTACKANDWGCMCKAQQQVVTCYNNCPSDPDAFGAQQQLTSWCNAAKAFPASSSTAAGPTGKTTAAPNTMSSTTKGHATPATGFANPSGSGSASASSSPTGAASGLTPAGGLVAAFFGLALL